MIDLFGFGARERIKKYEKEFSIFETDYDALQNDWLKIGQDYWTALDHERKIIDNELENESADSTNR